MKEYIIKVDDPGERAWDGGPKTFETQELVRCKDCMHYDRDENSNLGTCLENGVCSTPDWFCADGERKEGMHE